MTIRYEYLLKEKNRPIGILLLIMLHDK